MRWRFWFYGAESTNMVIHALRHPMVHYSDDYNSSNINTPEAKEVFEKINEI